MANLCSMAANRVGSYDNLIAPEGAESEMDKGVSVNSVGNNDTAAVAPSSHPRSVNRTLNDDLSSVEEVNGEEKLDAQTAGLLRAWQQLKVAKGRGAAHNSRLMDDITSIAKTKKIDPSALLHMQHKEVLGAGRENLLDSIGSTSKAARRAAVVDSDASFSDVGSDDEYEQGEDDWYLSQYTKKQSNVKPPEPVAQEEEAPPANDSLIEEEDLHIVAFGAKSFLDEIGGQSVGTETVKQTQHERALRKEHRQNSVSDHSDALLPLPEVDPDSLEGMYGSSLPDRLLPHVPEPEPIQNVEEMDPEILKESLRALEARLASCMTRIIRDLRDSLEMRMGELPVQLLSVLQQRIKAGLISVKEMEAACPSICAYIKNELVGPNVNCWIDLIYGLSLNTSNMPLWCDSANLKSHNKLMVQGSNDQAHLVYSAKKSMIGSVRTVGLANQKLFQRKERHKCPVLTGLGHHLHDEGSMSPVDYDNPGYGSRNLNRAKSKKIVVPGSKEELRAKRMRHIRMARAIRKAYKDGSLARLCETAKEKVAMSYGRAGGPIAHDLGFEKEKVQSKIAALRAKDSKK